jgi:hypothetical protein
MVFRWSIFINKNKTDKTIILNNYNYNNNNNDDNNNHCALD